MIILHLPDLTRVVFRVDEDQDIQEIQQEDNIRRRLQNFLPTDLEYDVYKPSVYSVHQRVVDHFREGRVILAGDSAHLNNPLGGMGMNSGIHDAYYLAPKLKEALETGSEEPLDDYCQTRRKAATQHVHIVSDKNYHNLTAKKLAQRRARNAELHSISKDPKRCREYLLRASMLEERI